MHLRQAIVVLAVLFSAIGLPAYPESLVGPANEASPVDSATFEKLLRQISSGTARVNIQQEHGGTCGSGFYLLDSASLYFVSAKHVFFDSVYSNTLAGHQVTLISNRFDADDSTHIVLGFDLDTLQSGGKLLTWDSIDVAILALGDIRDILNQFGADASLSSLPVIWTVDRTVSSYSIQPGTPVLTLGFQKCAAPAEHAQSKASLRIGFTFAQTSGPEILLAYPGGRGLSGAPVEALRTGTTSSWGILGVHVAELKVMSSEITSDTLFISKAVRIEKVLELIDNRKR